MFGRVQSPWMPASGDETYEIIRCRLFQTLDSDGERARDETIKAFHDRYKDKKNAADFPPEAREGRSNTEAIEIHARADRVLGLTPPEPDRTGQ